MMPPSDLLRVMLAFPGSQLVELHADDLAGHAIAYACGGYGVFPLRGKVPAISKAEGGNGVLDATNDLEQIGAWWEWMPGANIGGRVPEGVIVVDLDPRHGALKHLARLEAEHGAIVTRASWSGRGDGGRHYWFRHPGGRVSSSPLPDGWDLKTHSGYVVLPPSIHPDSRQPYRWEDPAAPIVDAPPWLVELLRPAIRPAPVATWRTVFTGDSIADWFTTTHSWADVLIGWTVASGNGDEDGSGWRHPKATSPVSATVTQGLLFVYSPNTPFEPTEAGHPHGYTRFRAWAVFEHGGDLAAAARAARELQRAAA
jgi:Bifunctional DNA primase/polymerase, N-terminal